MCSEIENLYIVYFLELGAPTTGFCTFHPQASTGHIPEGEMYKWPGPLGPVCL